jgi:hydroxyacylglutathione hydrolase
MLIRVLTVGPLGANCVILADERSHEAVVVDPGDDADEILQALAKDELKVVAILLTHAHIDHVGAAARLARVTGAPTYLHASDTPLLDKLELQARAIGLPGPEEMRIDHALADGQRLSFGSHTLVVLHTPGHSPGSVAFLVEKEGLCLTGDTLFAGGIGRTDLWFGDPVAITQSIRQRLYTLPEATKVIPGHGPSTTIARERATNPFVRP